MQVALKMRKFLKLLLTIGIVLVIVVQCIEYFFVIQYNAIPKLITKTLITKLIDDQELNFFKEDVKKHRATRSSCECPFPNLSINLTSYATSSCSLEAMGSGPKQNVISYSLFVNSQQDQEFFMDGISENMQKIWELFPDWIVYIFANMPMNTFSCNLICQYKNLFFCDIRRIPERGDLTNVNGRVWRFLPIFDANVDVFICRDLDSLPSVREKLAVDEWMRSNKTFHVMRDSHWHDTEILAGLWGAKTFLLSPEVKEHLQATFIREGRGDSRKIQDQELLETYVFSPYKHITLAHDSYFCGQFNESETLPFPTKRVGEEFVGLDKFKEVDRLFVGRLKSCPKKCRPIYGKDWKYC